ncbi:lipid-binding SYLF domain-containing protein [Massilia sp. Root335]|uniref:lipid-binding SYLF domain-containing protein n=1 Tax=Massilia sp. Root335 TaxID=1736517 RepID=UPI0006F8BD42|nr:lipid-binding SYLF domain-containing protein [Massilia sp. Root335]
MTHTMPRATPPTPLTDRRRSALRHALVGIAALLMLACALPAATAASGRAARGADSDTATRRQQTAVKHVSDAVGVVHTMDNEAGMAGLLDRARGVFIVPTYGRAALGVGGAGGAGVLMVRRADGTWGNPAFFDIGGLSIGLQAGAEGGPIALLLLNQKAVDSFRNRNNFSLSADAGLTVVNFARMAQGSTAGDVVVWSGSKGLFGNAVTVGINDVRYNRRLTEAYYGKPTTALQAIDSTEINAQADALRKVLGSPSAPAGSGGKTGGR